MKRKGLKRLQLTRETLHRLNHLQLGDVLGAATVGDPLTCVTCVGSCRIRTCPQLCGTNLTSVTCPTCRPCATDTCVTICGC